MTMNNSNGPGPFPQQGFTPGGVPSTLTPNAFDKWLETARNKNADEARLISAAMVYEAIVCAKAIGIALLPPDKFTTANCIEIAKLVLETENTLTEEEPVE